MFSKEKYSQCIGTTVIQSKTAQASRNSNDEPNYPGYISIPADAEGATSALVQVYYSPEEIAKQGMSLDDLAGKPLVTIDEYTDYSDVPTDQVNKEYSTPGMKLLNYGSYLIETANNISKAKIIPFNKEINVYVSINYYK